MEERRRLVIVWLISLVCTLSLTAFGQTGPDVPGYACRNQYLVEWTGYEEVKGPVERVDVKTETLVPQGDVLFTNQGRPILFATYLYSVGRLTEKNYYRVDGVALPKSTFVYDKDARPLKEVDYSAVSHNPYLETEYIYQEGLLKEVIGRAIGEDGFLSRKVFSYDPSRRYFEFSETHSHKSPVFRVGFQQNDDCRFEQIIVFDPDGKIGKKALNSFDSNGNVIATISMSSSGEVLGRVKSNYEYDSRGNWTKRSDYRWGESKAAGNDEWTLQEIIYRTIKYIDNE